MLPSGCDSIYKSFRRQFPILCKPSVFNVVHVYVCDENCHDLILSSFNDILLLEFLAPRNAGSESDSKRLDKRLSLSWVYPFYIGWAILGGGDGTFELDV